MNRVPTPAERAGTLVPSRPSAQDGDMPPDSATSTTERPDWSAVDAEREGWYEVVRLVRDLTPRECLEPGYYVDPTWSVRDLVAHLGTWLAEAAAKLERLAAGTYDGHDIDIDAKNAIFLLAMQDQPWDIAWLQAQAGRTRMLQAWGELPDGVDEVEVAWWIRKSGAEHYDEHLGRLGEWVDELVGRRPA
jgi:hypothetical protein